MASRDAIDEAFEAWWKLDSYGRQRTPAGPFYESARNSWRACAAWALAEGVKVARGGYSRALVEYGDTPGETMEKIARAIERIGREETT